VAAAATLFKGVAGAQKLRATTTGIMELSGVHHGGSARLSKPGAERLLTAAIREVQPP
jgi:hypothetical protein